MAVTTRARQTGTRVTVVSAEEEGLDPADGECRWYTICEQHSRLVGHRTRKLAQYHAADPEGWCEVCAGTEAPDEETGR